MKGKNHKPKSKKDISKLRKGVIDLSGDSKDTITNGGDCELIAKKYNPDWVHEYKMMREELVNYMDKLQTVRNMMYVAVGATLGLTLSTNVHFFTHSCRFYLFYHRICVQRIIGSVLEKPLPILWFFMNVMMIVLFIGNQGIIC